MVLPTRLVVKQNGGTDHGTAVGVEDSSCHRSTGYLRKYGAGGDDQQKQSRDRRRESFDNRVFQNLLHFYPSFQK